MILIHKQSEKLFCLVLNRPPLVGKSSLRSAPNPEPELANALARSPRLGLGVALASCKWGEGDWKHSPSNLLSALCRVPHQLDPLLRRVKLRSLACLWSRKQKGWEGSGGFTGPVTPCKSNINEGLCSSSVPGSLQNGVLTLQQHHGCKKSADIYRSRKDSGWWQPGQCMWASGPTDRLALGRDSCLYDCESGEESDHTRKSTQSLHSLERQPASGRGQMGPQTGMAVLLTSELRCQKTGDSEGP